MQTSTNPVHRKRTRRRIHPKLAGAVFGALATFLVLLAATVVPDTPRHLPDINGTLAAAEMFDGSPLPAFETADNVVVLAPALHRHKDFGLQMNDEVPA